VKETEKETIMAETIAPPAPQTKVTWLKHQLPAVNSHEYWQFRKANGDQTHQDVTSTLAAKALPRDATRNTVFEWLTKTYDTDKVAGLPAGSNDRQILQYLGQLTERGWNRLANSVITKIAAREAAK
jgi:hypothetical protein